MRKIRDVLRLTQAMGMSRRLVGEATGIGKTAVGEYVRRAAVAGLALAAPGRRSMMPSWSGGCFRRRMQVVCGAHRSGLVAHPCGDEAAGRDAGSALAGVSRRARPRLRLQLVLRAVQRLAEVHHADDAPDASWRARSCSSIGPATPSPVFDPITGEAHGAQIFVAAIGASNYTYAEARWSETLPDWIGVHVNALPAIGGVPKSSCSIISRPALPSLALRARYQPNLPGFGRPLRLRGAADAREEATRQGEGRGRGPDRRALGAGQSAQPALLLAGRAECRDSRMRCAINASHAQSRHQPRRTAGEIDHRLRGCRGHPIALRTGSVAASRPTITSRSTAITTPSRSRLIRELVEARITDATVEIFHKGSRVASHAFAASPSAHDDCRAHAERPSPLRRLDAGA